MRRPLAVMFHGKQFLFAPYHKYRFFSTGPATNLLNFLQSLPGSVLRSFDTNNFDVKTHQRVNYHFDRLNGKPILETHTQTSPERYDTNFISSAYLNGESKCIIIHWNDGSTSSIPFIYLQEQWDMFQRKNHYIDTSFSDKFIPRRIPWKHWTESFIRGPSSPIRVPFQEILQIGSDHHYQAIQMLYTYGMLFVTDMPSSDFHPHHTSTTESAIAALAAALSGGTVKTSTSSLFTNYHQRSADHHNLTSSAINLIHGTDGPLKTLYGVIWTTEAASMVQGTSTADSSYGHDALPLHTDLTYFLSPPGLQIFTMVQQASIGGESIFCDGFTVAETLRKENDTAFDILCRTRRNYRCIDDECGWHLQASGPVIHAQDLWENDPLGSYVDTKNHSHRWGSILAIRHNDLDRLPDKIPIAYMSTPARHNPLIQKFYDELAYAHYALDEILSRDEFRLVVKMNPGETMVVVNQRCLHGRFAFEVDERHPRKVMGCYVSQDDLLSMFRSTLGVQGAV